jgi:hypothetical protein
MQVQQRSMCSKLVFALSTATVMFMLPQMRKWVMGRLKILLSTFLLGVALHLPKLKDM